MIRAGQNSRRNIFWWLIPVYLGPVLAGLSLAPWRYCIAICALGIVVVGRLRLPHPFDVSNSFVRGAGFLVHCFLAVFLFMFAFEMGTLFGRLPVPHWLPVALTALGSAGIWHLLPRLRFPDLSVPVGGGDGVEAALTPLRGTDALSQTDITFVLARIQLAAPPEQCFNTLLANMDEGHDAIDLAAMLFLQRPEGRAAAMKDGRLEMALTLGLTSPAKAVSESAEEVARTLIAENAPPEAFPPRDRLSGLASTFPHIAETIGAIAAHLTKGSPSP